MAGMSQSSRAMTRPKYLKRSTKQRVFFWLLVGGELAFDRRRHLRRQLLPLPLGREFSALGRLLVPRGAGGPCLQPAQAALGGASPPNSYRPVRVALGEVGP